MSGNRFPSIYEKIPNTDQDNYDHEQQPWKTVTSSSSSSHQLSRPSTTIDEDDSSHGQERGDINVQNFDEYLVSSSTILHGGQSLNGTKEEVVEMIPPSNSSSSVTTAKSDDVYGRHDIVSSFSRDFVMNGDDDEEEDFTRYSAVFSPTNDERRGPLQLQNRERQNQQGYHKAKASSWHLNDSSYSSGENNYGWMKSSPVRRLIHKIHDARMESKRKRMERLLALPDGASIQNHKERCFLFFNTWCDLLDKGIFLILFLLFVYIIILATLGEEHVFVKKMMLGLGIPFFIFRISWRPLSWLVYDQQCGRVSTGTSAS